MDGIINKCAWDQDEYQGDTWATDCGEHFTIIEGTPVANGFKFCPFCGDEIEQHEVKECQP